MKQINYLDNKTFIDKIERTNDDYCIKYYLHSNRWKYISIVIDELKKINPNKILEIGAFKLNLTSISDNMDLKIEYIDIDNIDNKKYIQNAEKLPWNIPDKYYDVIIALQVFEHLNKKIEIFEEIKRTSKYAILSFPYKWNCPNDIIHHNIDDKIIGEWVKNTKPENIIYESNFILYFFNFNNNS